MDDQTAQHIIMAVDEFRTMMVKTYCEDAEKPVEAVIQLSSQFIAQAAVCLGAVYGNDKSIIQKHMILLIVRSLEDEPELISE